MATFQSKSWTVPDAKATIARDGICRLYGYQDTIIDENGDPQPNEQTKTQFAQQMLDNHIKNLLIQAYKNQVSYLAQQGLDNDLQAN